MLLLRAVAVLCALGWLVFPGSAVPDLLVTWDPDWPVALEAGWGLLCGVLLATAFLRLAGRPRRSAAALVQIWTATAALAALLAALWPGGRRYLGGGAGTAAGYLGLVSLAWPGTPGGMGGTWSLLTTVWGLAVAGLSALGPREAPRAADLRRGAAASGPGRRPAGWGA